MRTAQAHGWSDVSIKSEFSVVSGFFRQLSRKIEDTAQTSTSASTGGQISLVQYNPLTPIQQKIAIILKMLQDGEIAPVAGKLADVAAKEIVKELTENASRYEGRSVKDIVFDLKTKEPKLLLDDTQPRLKHPAPRLMTAFAPAFAMG